MHICNTYVSATNMCSKALAFPSAYQQLPSADRDIRFKGSGGSFFPSGGGKSSPAWEWTIDLGNIYLPFSSSHTVSIMIRTRIKRFEDEREESEGIKNLQDPILIDRARIQKVDLNWAILSPALLLLKCLLLDLLQQQRCGLL